MENNNRQGCRWVKASERLPEDAKLVFIKIDGTIMIVGRYIGERKLIGNTYGDYFVDFNGGKLHTTLEQIEWLDENNE